MQDLARLHDDALYHENEIEEGIEELREIRLKMYNDKNPKILKRLTPVLNTIISDVEGYKNWLSKL